MIIHVTMKTPDALSDAIDEAFEDIDSKAIEFLPTKQMILNICKRWFDYDETIHLTINTETGDCTVDEKWDHNGKA